MSQDILSERRINTLFEDDIYNFLITNNINNMVFLSFSLCTCLFFKIVIILGDRSYVRTLALYFNLVLFHIVPMD